MQREYQDQNSQFCVRIRLADLKFSSIFLERENDIVKITAIQLSFRKILAMIPFSYVSLKQCPISNGILLRSGLDPLKRFLTLEIVKLNRGIVPY